MNAPESGAPPLGAAGDPRGVADSNTSRLAAALAEAAEALSAHQSLDERLATLIAAVPGAVPGFDHASVSVASRGTAITTRASSSDLAETLDTYQYEAEEGPCYDALARPGILLSTSMRHEQRWPEYTRRAIEAGVTAQMAVHLGDGGPVRGALNLYCTSGQEVDPEAPGAASLAATYVALALGWARTEEQLNEALSSRKEIGQAIGIVMERYQIDEAKAFAFLARVSSTGNIKLRDVARELVQQTDARYAFKES